MKRLSEFKPLLLTLLLYTYFPAFAQDQLNSQMTEKAGKWTIKNNLSDCSNTVDKAAFSNSLTKLAEWFHSSNPALRNIRGYDLELAQWINCYQLEQYRYHDYDYAFAGEIDFNFQLFLRENGKDSKWTIEPPHWNIMINNTTSGHGSNFTNYEGYRVQDDPAAIEKPMEDAVKKLGEYFTVAPVDIKIAPGITLYQDGNLVVANPARPPYWVPATVKEVFEAKMNYYRIRPDDKLVYDFLKSAYEELSAVALYADAYYGSEDGIVNINSTGTGPQIMKFNKAYYDRSLPKTAIQLLSFHWSYADENAFAEFIKNNNHPDYVGLFKNGIDLKELAALIEKGN